MREGHEFTNNTMVPIVDYGERLEFDRFILFQRTQAKAAFIKDRWPIIG
jgi:hypothetical protein